jgi:hypothetical protein
MPPSVFSPAVALTVGVVNSVALPGTLRRTVWKFTSPEEMCHATRRFLVDGSSDVSSIVIRLSGRTCTIVPSKKAISAAAPGPVRTRSLLRRTIRVSAGTHSNWPTGFTRTLPSRDRNRAVVTLLGGGGASVEGLAFAKRKKYAMAPTASTPPTAR